MDDYAWAMTLLDHGLFAVALCEGSLPPLLPGTASAITPLLHLPLSPYTGTVCKHAALQLLGSLDCTCTACTSSPRHL